MAELSPFILLSGGNGVQVLLHAPREFIHVRYLFGEDHAAMVEAAPLPFQVRAAEVSAVVGEKPP
jgi:hypothetical protein